MAARMSQEVATVSTPASASDVLGALIGAGLSKNAAVMVAAQSALETGGWQQMWNWNLGNVTTNDDYYTIGSNPLHFRPSDSLSAGAVDFVGYLSGRGLIPYADAGDLSGYVGRLQAIGYAGNADYGAYQTGMQTWIDKLGGVTPTYAFPWKTLGIVAGILLGAGATA